MVLAVEPMVTAGRHMVRMGDDGWAIYSQDGSLAAHFEFTIAITTAGPRILTPWHHPAAQRPPPEPATDHRGAARIGGSGRSAGPYQTARSARRLCYPALSRSEPGGFCV